MMRRIATFALLSCCALGCRDVDRWSSRDGRYEGAVVSAEFVRTGVTAGTKLCLTLDTARLEDAPGTLTSSDGRFAKTPLVPIAAVQHDPLSTISFGTGRAKNLLFGAREHVDGGPSDVLVIISLMETGGVELRLLRSSGDRDAGAGVFAVFPLERESGSCSIAPQ